MELDFIHHYLSDARQIYLACITSLGLSDSAFGLSALMLSARKGEISRRGKFTISDGNTYEYRIHGVGYSFNELRSGKTIHFDVMSTAGVDHIRFSPWKLCQYASSIGESISEEIVASELRRLSSGKSCIVHVIEGPFDYYYAEE